MLAPGLGFLLLLLAACGNSAAPRGAAPPQATTHLTGAPPGSHLGSSPALAPTTGGCGPTPALVGGRPAWVPDRTDETTPYVIASPPTAVAILAAHPLRAGHPTNPSNKVAWGTRTPKKGTPLLLDAHPVGASLPVVRFTEPATSVMDARNIYTSTIDLPTPGCWQLRLRWGSPPQATTIQLMIFGPSG